MAKQQYSLVVERWDYLVYRVRERLDNGWKLYGTPFVVEKDSITMLGQALIKEDDNA